MKQLEWVGQTGVNKTKKKHAKLRDFKKLKKSLNFESQQTYHISNLLKKQNHILQDLKYLNLTENKWKKG